MKLASRPRFLLVGLVASLGCGPLASTTHGQDVDVNHVAIRKLTVVLENEPLRFLELVTREDVNRLLEDPDHLQNLGFGCVLDEDTYRHDNQIHFWVQIVRCRGALVSYAVAPIFPTKIDDRWRAMYRGSYEEAGWKPAAPEEFPPFQRKFYRYEATTAPVDLPGSHRPQLDALMTPYLHHWVSMGLSGLYARGDFARAAAGLDDAGWFYLLHALNPATRVTAIHEVRCGGRKHGREVEDWLHRLLGDPSAYRASLGCMGFDAVTERLARCGPL